MSIAIGKSDLGETRQSAAQNSNLYYERWLKSVINLENVEYWQLGYEKWLFCSTRKPYHHHIWSYLITQDEDLLQLLSQKTICARIDNNYYKALKNWSVKDFEIKDRSWNYYCRDNFVTIGNLWSQKGQLARRKVFYELPAFMFFSHPAVKPLSTFIVEIVSVDDETPL